MTDWQREISEHVAERGYERGSMSEANYVLSQLAKCIIEAHELLQCFGLDIGVHPFAADVERAVVSAGWIFNNDKRIGHTRMNAELARGELIDTLIPLLVAATTLGVDVEQMAVSKARSDKGRGVR